MAIAPYRFNTGPDVQPDRMEDFIQESAVAAEQASAVAAPDRSFGEEFGAVFERENPIASFVADVTELRGYTDIDDTADPDFNVVDAYGDLEKSDRKYQRADYFDMFADVGNQQQFEAKQAELDRELENQHIQDTSSWGAYLAGLGASVVTDPTILMPGGSMVRGIRGGYSLGKTALNVGIAGAAGAAASEGLLQASQDTRTALETTTAIGGGFLLGGLLGGAGAKLLSRAEYGDFSARLAKEMQEEGISQADLEQRVKNYAKQTEDLQTRLIKDLTATGMDEAKARPNAEVFSSYIRARAEDLGMEPVEVEKMFDIKIEDGNIRVNAAQADMPGALPMEAYDQSGRVVTQSEPFRNWFGESKVVDEAGQPMRVFHGTNQAIEEFEAERLGDMTHAVSAKGGFYFTDSAKEASDYADAAADRMPAKIAEYERRTEEYPKLISKAERRRDWDEAQRLTEEWEAFDGDALRGDPEGATVVPVYLSVKNPMVLEIKGQATTGRVAEAIEQAKADGYDGLVLREIQDGPVSGPLTNHYVAFDPTQIKSVNNRGTFDPNDPRILNQDASSVLNQVGKYESDLLSPIGQSRMVGGETTILDTPDLKISEADVMLSGGKRSLRYVQYEDGQPVAVLQFMTQGKRSKKATIQNIYVAEAKRRQKYGAKLLRRAQEDYDIKHSKDLTDDGQAFASADGRYYQNKRGQIDIPQGGVLNGETIIKLMESADSSTFMHESAHFFLEADKALAANPKASQAFKDDVKAVHEWLEVGDGQKIPTEAHEKFARAFESYLRDGNAPSPRLARAFESFKRWLTQLYRSADELGVEVPDEIKGVFDRMLTTTDDFVAPEAKSGGAAAVSKTDIDDFKIAGRAARAVAKVSNNGLFPGIQVMQSPSQGARQAYNMLVENTVMNEAQAAGRSTGEAVETSLKYWTRGAQAKFLQAEKKHFKAARKDGYQGRHDEFAVEVARAARRGDEHDNPHIQAAAEDVRRMVFEPLLKRSELPDDLKTGTSMSYVTRIYNKTAMFAEEQAVKRRFRQYFRESIEAEFKKTEEVALGERILAAEKPQKELQAVEERLGNLEGQLGKRASARSKKLSKLRSKEASRRTTETKRLEPALMQVLTDESNGSFIDLVKSAKAEIQRDAKAQKYPIIDKIRASGGVRVGSNLDKELRNMDVTPRSFPGLFKKEGGITDIDNLEIDELISFFGAEGEDGFYADPIALFNAIGDELAGNPWRLPDEYLDEQFIEAVDEILGWLNLNVEDATVSQVRKAIDDAIKADDQSGKLNSQVNQLVRDLDDHDKLTDTVKNQKIVEESKARELQANVARLNEGLADITDAQRRLPRVRNVIKMATMKRDLSDVRLKRSNAERRIAELNKVRQEDLTPELRMELDAKHREMDNFGERIFKLEADIGSLEKFMPKSGASRDDFVSEADLNEYLDEIVNATFNNIVGRGTKIDDEMAVPPWMVPDERGYLKDRVFKIDDEILENIDGKGTSVLEEDIRGIVANYTRTMGAEVELTRKFGDSSLKDQFDVIKEDYDKLRAEVPNTINDEAAQLKAIKRLNKREESDMKNLRAMRDQIRGTYRVDEMNDGWGKATRLALSWNYVRLLGGVTLSSASDAVRVATSHGITRMLTDVVMPMMTADGRGARSIAKQEAREMGAVVETYLNSRLATLAELDNPHASGSKFERVMANATNAFTTATGLPLWNDVMKSSVATMTQNRIIEAALKGTAKLSDKEKVMIAKLGLGDAELDRIAVNYKRFGSKEGRTHISGVSQWGDDDAMLLAQAINKSVDQVVVTKGVGDTPLFMTGNTGKLIMQFKSFALASHQRVLLSGLQGEPQKLLSFIVGGTAIGMMVSYLKMVERGDYERADALVANPGRWVADGLDRTGIFAVLFDILNTGDKLSSSQGGPAFGPGAIGGLIAGDGDNSGGSTRYASRNSLGAVLGPTAGAFQDIMTIFGQSLSGDIKTSGANAMIRQVPGATLPGARSAIHHWIKPELQDAVN